MSLVSLSCDSIGDLDGGMARGAIDREIARAVADLDDRAAEDGQKRVVAINIELTHKDGMLVARCLCQAKLPPYRTGGTVAKMNQLRGEAQLQFQSLAPDNPDQKTFGVLDNEGEDE